MVVGNFLHELRFRCKVAVGLHGTRCVFSMFLVVSVCRSLVLRLRRFRMVLLSSVQFSCDMTDVFKLRVSSHTFCPLTNGVNMFILLAAICDRANSCAANVSSLFLINCFIFSSISWNFVCSNERGIAIGVSPCISSKGVFVLSACCRLLCVNSKVPRVFDQFSGLETQ